MLENCKWSARLLSQAKGITKEKINIFLASPRFIVLVMILAALGNMFSLELMTYTFFIAIGVYICLWGADFLPLMPMIIASYITPSASNNPGKNAASVFALDHGGWWLILLSTALITALIYRVIRDRKTFFKQDRRLLSGILALAVAYILGGIGSTGYTDSVWNHFLFAFLQGACIFVPYYLLTGGINWKKVRKDYFAWLGFCVAWLLVWEVLWIYLSSEVILKGSISRDRIYTGWGMYNNMGSLLMMMIPFAFYLAKLTEKDWVGIIGGFVQLLGVLITASRNSILVGATIYCLCVIWYIYRAADRRKCWKLVGCIVGICLVSVLLFHGWLYHLFRHVLRQGMDLSHRDTIYEEGLKLFGQYPVFGVSFFSPGYVPWDWSSVESFSKLIPPRWHNTYVQLLTSGGLVAMGAYVMHRWQTVKLYLKQPSREKSYIGLSLAAWLFACLFDCHFFNIGPALFYAMALAFAECISKSQIPRKLKKQSGRRGK